MGWVAFTCSLLKLCILVSRSEALPLGTAHGICRILRWWCFSVVQVKSWAASMGAGVLQGVSWSLSKTWSSQVCRFPLSARQWPSTSRNRAGDQEKCLQGTPGPHWRTTGAGWKLGWGRRWEGHVRCTKLGTQVGKRRLSKADWLVEKQKRRSPWFGKLMSGL